MSSEEHPRTSTSNKAAVTFTEQFCEQVVTPAPALVMTPFHDDPFPLLDSKISDTGITLNRHTETHVHTLFL